LVRGQDADTIVLKNDNRKFTLVSQIEDVNEAAAFMTCVQAGDSAARYALAHKFLAAYPQSWLLPQAYDLAARSAIDLGKYQEALDAGRFSLRLVRENPSLLILLANIEAQQNELARAVADASDALDYLQEIERPPNMSQDEWNILKPQMNASAYFARARAEAGRAQEQAAALADLNKAAAWNERDPEVFYLRAIVELRLNNKEDAIADLTFVSSSENALQQKAQSALHLLPKPLVTPGRIIDAKLREEPRRLLDDPQALAAGYAGPEACKSCHAAQYASWRQTGMAKMLQPYRRENLIGDFSGSEYKETETGRIRIGFAARPYFEVASAATWQRFYVDYTIGSKWQQGYATKLPDGRLQVLPIEYNMLLKKWINYWKMIDPPGSPRTVVEDFPKLTAVTNYQQNCAICHTSQLKLDRMAASPMEHAIYLQPGIDCEMCHGPSARHVKHTEERPFSFRQANNRQAVQICAQCHRQSAVREIGEGGEMNYSTKGSFAPLTSVRSYDAFSRKAFYKDGRFRETTFMVEAFTRSACYRRGNAQCASCHSPHVENFKDNLTSLKDKDNPNEMCLPCHAPYRSRIAEHSHHAAGSEASQCVSCHMPRIMNAVLFKARSHQIEIPTADLTERFGPVESPNACLSCHSEKGATWAKEQLAAWRH
jgi:tetratricopeptide (TPR) repeat protein